MQKRWLCQADVTLDLTCVDPVLVKSGYATLDGPDMVPVVTYRNGKKEYFLPGSSLKGVLRSHSERVIRTLARNMVCVPYIQRASYAAPDNDLHMACGSRLRNRTSKPDCYRYACPACRMFGSLEFAGRTTISDAYPIGRDPVVEQRDGVGIDRYTGGAARDVKFELMVITAGTFRATLTVRNFELWQLGLLHVLLQDLQDAYIRVGSGKSRGLGRVRAEIAEYRLSYVGTPPQLVGLFELASPRERELYGLQDSSAISLPLPDPVGSSGLRQLYDLSALWVEFGEPLVQLFRAFLSAGYRPAADWRSAIEGQTAKAEAYGI